MRRCEDPSEEWKARYVEKSKYERRRYTGKAHFTIRWDVGRPAVTAREGEVVRTQGHLTKGNTQVV